jgi:hypothetical protein
VLIKRKINTPNFEELMENYQNIIGDKDKKLDTETNEKEKKSEHETKEHDTNELLVT